MYWQAYQNGKEIDMDTEWDTLPEGTDGYGGTNVMNGYTTTGYYGFVLKDLSPVELHIKSLWGDDYAVLTIDPSTMAAGNDVSVDDPVSEEVGAPSVGEKLVELEQRIAELEARVAELEG